MEADALELDDQPRFGPERVGEVVAIAGLDRGVEERRAEPAATDEGGEALLELLASDAAAAAHVVEGPPQSAGAALASVPLEEGSEGEGIGELAAHPPR